MKRVFIVIAVLLLLAQGACKGKFHRLDEGKEFTVSRDASEEVWSKAHDFLVREHPEKYSRTLSSHLYNDYSIIIHGYWDYSGLIAKEGNISRFNPYYYSLTFSRHRENNNFVHFIQLYGMDREENFGVLLMKEDYDNKNSKDSGLLKREIERIYGNIAPGD